MKLMLLGLLTFICLHSLRIFGEGFRLKIIDRLGHRAFKFAVTLISVAALALSILGYWQAEQDPHILWVNNFDLVRFGALLTLPSFVLVAAAYVPSNSIKSKFRHPLSWAMILFALSHLLGAGEMHKIVYFGLLLAWGLLALGSALERDGEYGLVYVPGSRINNLIVLLLGSAAWIGVAFYAHIYVLGTPALLFGN